jgi:tetratricopeptide (TPR) repeat protein
MATEFQAMAKCAVWRLVGGLLLAAGCRTSPPQAPPWADGWTPISRALTRDEVLGRVHRASNPAAKRLLEEAKCLVTESNYVAVARLFETCIDRYPKSKEVIDFARLGSAYRLSNDDTYEEARRLFDKAVLKGPGDFELWESLIPNRLSVEFHFVGAHTETTSPYWDAGRMGFSVDAHSANEFYKWYPISFRSVDGACSPRIPLRSLKPHIMTVQAAELRAVEDAIKRGDSEEVEARLEHRRLSYPVRMILLERGERTLAPGMKPEPAPLPLDVLARTAIAACNPQPHQPRSWYWRGRLYEFLCDFERAADDYRMGLDHAKIDDLRGKLRHRLAEVMRLQGETTGALELFEANFTDPGTREPWGVEGMMLCAWDAMKAANAKYRRAEVAASNEQAAASAFLAAAVPFARVMDEAPRNRSAASAGVLAGQLLMRGGDRVGAVKRLKAVAENYPDDAESVPEALYRQSDAYLKDGKMDAARATHSLLRQKYPNSRWSRYHLIPDLVDPVQ